MNKTEMAKMLNMDYKTFRNWETGRPEVFNIIVKHFESKKECPDFESPDYMINEINNDLKKLPLGQIKIIYYTIKTKLAEMGH